MNNDVREPKQQRAVAKKDKIIDAGWKLICQTGYYNTNTANIAKYANVSTGIVYQYFKDKHDILVAAINKYGDEIFFPMLKLDKKEMNTQSISNVIEEMINEYATQHKVSERAHEEIMAMVHLDKDIAEYYYDREINLTNKMYEMLILNGVKDDNLLEKVHIIIGLIDSYCHEVAYHKHESLDYNIMKDNVLKTINFIVNEK